MSRTWHHRPSRDGFPFPWAKSFDGWQQAFGGELPARSKVWRIPAVQKDLWERTGKVKLSFEYRVETLQHYSCPDYPGWNMRIPDADRADSFLREFGNCEKKGEWAGVHGKGLKTLKLRPDNVETPSRDDSGG